MTDTQKFLLFDLVAFTLITIALIGMNVGTVLLLGWEHLFLTGTATLLLIAGFISTIGWEVDEQ